MQIFRKNLEELFKACIKLQKENDEVTCEVTDEEVNRIQAAIKKQNYEIHSSF